MITAVQLQCTEDDNRSYRYVCNMSFVSVVAVMITSDYLQLRAFHAAVGIAYGTRSTCACLPAAVR